MRELEADGSELSDDAMVARSGTSELENGRICEWTLVRGQSADGSVEWEEKWWSSADAFDYKELSAIKSSDGHGNVWQDRGLKSPVLTSLEFLHGCEQKNRTFRKQMGCRREWCRMARGLARSLLGRWRRDRECFKKSCIGKNKIPEDGRVSMEP